MVAVTNKAIKLFNKFSRAEMMVLKAALSEGEHSNVISLDANLKRKHEIKTTTWYNGLERLSSKGVVSRKGAGSSYRLCKEYFFCITEKSK